MNWNDIQQIVRIAAYGVAGWLANAGGLDPSNTETLAGGIIALASVGWWWFWNRKKA